MKEIGRGLGTDGLWVGIGAGIFASAVFIPDKLVVSVVPLAIVAGFSTLFIWYRW